MYLSKKEAAEYLGVSQRGIARYAQQGKLSVKYVKGKKSKGKIIDINPQLLKLCACQDYIFVI